MTKKKKNSETIQNLNDKYIAEKEKGNGLASGNLKRLIDAIEKRKKRKKSS